jgi:glycine/D-amino acid oxidase-like deaminating enzyme
VTAGAVRDLFAAAIELVPALALAKVGRAWCNFRPYTPDELPILGF